MDNDEIEVGEYIRSKDGYIDKVERIVYDELEKKNYYACERSVMASGFKEDIAKHRKNIIDLVEVGDYVNGYIVLDVMEDMQTGEIHLEMPMNYTNKELGDCTIYNKDIKSLVTKEQFESVEFRVEE